MDNTEVIKNICEALLAGDKDKAQSLARKEYPFQVYPRLKRKISLAQSIKLFSDDGFIDRYSGQRLVYPGILRFLSKTLPDEFPYHPNWKMDECHMVYWELYPTVDHIVPIARGGSDNESNWVTTSMLKNSVKSNWTLEELGWSLFPKGNLREWNGLLRVYIELFEALMKTKSTLSQDTTLSRWYKAAKKVNQFEGAL